MSSQSAVSRWSTVGLVALLGAAALDITGRIGQIGPARFTAYQLLALAMTVFVGWLLVTRRADLPSTPLTAPVLAFLGFAALSLAFATELAPAVVQLVSLTSSVLLAVVVLVLVRGPRQGGRVVAGALGVAAAMGILAVIEWAGGFAVRYPVFFTPGYGIRARVTFDDPNILASFLMTAILLAVPLLLTAPLSRRVRAVGWIAVVCALTGLVTTFSRGAAGGLVLGFIAIVALARMSRRMRTTFLVLVVVAMLLAGALVLDAQWISENVLNISNNGSVMNRVYMVQGALRMWAAHPFGVGLDNYQVLYPVYRHPLAEPGIIESHLAYATVLAEMGFLGLLAFLWVLGSFFFRCVLPAARRCADPTLQALAVGAAAAGIGMSAQAFTYSLEGSKFWWFAIGLGAAVWRLWTQERAEGESTLT